MTIRVLIADDQELVRAGLAAILGSIEGFEVAGLAVDGADLVRQARSIRPDVCLVDIRMPGMDGIEATRQLAGPDVEHPIAVVVITTFDLDEYVFAALRAGAKGFLLKDAGATLLAEAVRAAARGDALIAPQVTVRLIEEFARRAPNSPRPGPREPLTGREEEILAAVALGQSNAEIASALFVSVSTVKTHLARLMDKLDARNRVELAIWAHENPAETRRNVR